MVKVSASARYALVAVALIGAGSILAGSPRARTSLRAAYVAFRDPRLLREGPDDPRHEPTPRAAPEIDQPELSGDFGRVNEADLADAGAGALATLTLPDLPIPISQRTLRFVAYFAASEGGREAFVTRFRRAGRYRGYIEQALRDAGLPEDLLWLCAIESGFEPQAMSPKGAAGMFQFMPETAARYGLVQNELVDERRSVPRGTTAAVAHLRDLFELYRQWDLVLAGYNLGHERLDDAIAHLRQRRGPRDENTPVELKDLVDARLIPKETANFVPQVHAFAIVAANRGRFGLDDLDPATPFEFGEIAVPAGTPLRLVSRAAGVSVAVLRDYNPGLLRDRTPGGADTLVSVPADRVAAALAAFPTLYARENDKLAAASASVGARGAPTGVPAASAPTSSTAQPPQPTSDRFALPGGLIVECKVGPGPDVAVTARVEVLERGSPRPGAFDVAPVTARPAELASAMARVGQAIHALSTDGGQAAVEARRLTNDPRRQRLAKAPYGGSWLALGDWVFPPGSALAGTVLTSPALPLTSVAIAEMAPSFAGALRVTITVTGPVERGAVAEAAERVLAGVLDSRGAPALLSHEERAVIEEAVPSARVLFGWVAPSESDADRAALRLAILALAHNEVGRVARALVSEARVAVHVRGFLDLGERVSVAAIEVVPMVLHDVADVERETTAALAAFAERGPTAAELTAAKAQHRARIQSERPHVGSRAEPRDVALARLSRISERADGVTAEELTAILKRVFVQGHRAVAITRPRS